MSLRAVIEAGGKALCDGINNEDAAAAAACYSEDGSVLAPNAPQANGRNAIQAFWQTMIDADIKDVSLEAVEIEEHGDSATEVGIARASAPAEGGGRTSLVGKYIVLWKKDATGTWRMHRDIWNFDA